MSYVLVWLVTSRLGTGKSLSLFYSAVQLEEGKVHLCGYMNENAQANGFSNRKGLNVFHDKQLGKYRKGKDPEILNDCTV